MIRPRSVAIALPLLFCMMLSTAHADKLGNAEIKGKLYGQNVKLTSARLSNTSLELYAGDSWAFNSSLLIFLFDDEKKVAPGKTIKYTSSAKGFGPHIHSRYPKGKDTDVTVIMKGYDMKIGFTQPIKGYLPARFTLAIPGTNTQLKGKFFLKLDKDGKVKID